MSSGKFLETFAYLGGKIALEEQGSSFDKSFVDIEDFFLESSLYLDNDKRIKNGILNWYFMFAPLLSPSKLRRKIKEKKLYSNNRLKEIILRLKRKNIINHQWDIIDDCLKPNGKEESLLSFFISDFSKYLRTNSYISKNCPELFFRMDGFSPIIADIKAARLKRNFRSCHELAKVIGHPKNLVYSKVALLEKFTL